MKPGKTREYLGTGLRKTLGKSVKHLGITRGKHGDKPVELQPAHITAHNHSHFNCTLSTPRQSAVPRLHFAIARGVGCDRRARSGQTIVNKSSTIRRSSNSIVKVGGGDRPAVGRAGKEGEHPGPDKIHGETRGAPKSARAQENKIRLIS